MTYYNTLGFKAQELLDKISKAGKQDHKVYTLIKDYREKTLTARRVWWLHKRVYGEIELNSVRRSINTLINGNLAKYGERIKLKCPVNGNDTQETTVSVV